MRKVHKNLFLDFERFRNSAGSEGVRTACIILNSKDIEVRISSILKLWNEFDLTVCADGGANRLYDGLSTNCSGADNISRCIPTYIKGDLDSLRTDVEKFYTNNHCQILRDQDQNTNDLQKCLQLIKDVLLRKDLVSSISSAHQSNSIEERDKCNETSKFSENVHVHSTSSITRPTASEITVVIFGAFGGRFDQQIAILDAIYQFAEDFDRLVLIGDGNCATLLTPGKPGNERISCASYDGGGQASEMSSNLRTHVLELIPGVEGPGCGLLPVGNRCNVVTTTGLKWNLSSQALALGELISSSNRAELPVVTVQTSHPLLWYCELDLDTISG